MPSYMHIAVPVLKVLGVALFGSVVFTVVFTASFAIIFRRVGYVLAVIDSISYEDEIGREHV